MKKRYHSADVVKTLDLRTERSFLVEVAVNEVAVLFGCYPAHSVDADAAGVADHLADHVLGHFILVTANRKIVVALLIALMMSIVTSGKMQQI